MPIAIANCIYSLDNFDLPFSQPPLFVSLHTVQDHQNEIRPMSDQYSGYIEGSQH